WADCAQAVGKVRSAVLHREHGGGRRQSRHGRRCQGDSRRLHDPVRVIELHRQSEPLRQASLRSRQGLRARHQGRGFSQRPVRESQHSGQIGEGTGGAHQGQSRKVHVRLTWHRYHAASLERAVQAHLRLDFALAPFPGGGPSIQSVVAGRTPMCFQAIPPAPPLVKDGKLRALAVTAAARSPALPDVPTLDELGIKNQEAETMQGVLLPAGTPKSIVDLLQTEIARIIHLPDVKDKLLAIGLEPDGMSPAAFAAYIKADVAKWKKVIADAKIPQIGG